MGKRLIKKNVLAVCFTALLCWTIPAGTVPTVSNVRISQDALTRIVKITYDLSGSDAIITIDLQTNAVANAAEDWTSISGRHLRSLAGAVNRLIAVSNDVQAIWIPDVDLPDASVAAGYLRAVVKAWPVNSPPDYWAIDLSGGKCHFYYPDVDCLPEGIGSDKWRMEQMLMRRIPARDVVWQMGSPESELGRDTSTTYGANMEKQHKVKLTHDYYIGVFEVTQYQIAIARAGAGAKIENKFTNGLYWATRPSEYSDFADRFHNNTDPTSSDPAVRHQCENWKITGVMRNLSGLDHYLDLPTEAQWEFACRAGSTNALYDGNELLTTDGEDENLSKLARYRYTVESVDADYGCGTSSGTARVGTYESNDWGLYDMLGNVAEMCLDCYSSYTNVTDETTIDPYGTKFYGASSSNPTSYRVIRGGSYKSNAQHCRSASRDKAQIWSPDGAIGARMCYTLVNDDVDVSGSRCESAPLSTGLISFGGEPVSAEGDAELRCVPRGCRVTVR
jgi:formylglycine-generating enzyme required for sulfatase activity